MSQIMDDIIKILAVEVAKYIASNVDARLSALEVNDLSSRIQRLEERYANLNDVVTDIVESNPVIADRINDIVERTFENYDPSEYEFFDDKVKDVVRDVLEDSTDFTVRVRVS